MTVMFKNDNKYLFKRCKMSHINSCQSCIGVKHNQMPWQFCSSIDLKMSPELSKKLWLPNILKTGWFLPAWKPYLPLNPARGESNELK